MDCRTTLFRSIARWQIRSSSDCLPRIQTNLLIRRFSRSFQIHRWKSLDDMVTIKHALIMAAGRGTRMLPLTDVIPKPMAPYRGTTLIAEGIRRIRIYIENIHITVGYKGKTLAEHVVELGVNSVFNTSGRGNAWW